MAAKKSAKSVSRSAAKKAAGKASPQTQTRGGTRDEPALQMEAGPSVSAAPAKPKSPGSAKPVRPSVETVARAAYLIYRRRVELGLPGDSHGDWLQAERELAESRAGS